MECEEKYLGSLQLLKQEKQTNKHKANKHNLSSRGDVAENLLQLNLTPARNFRMNAEKNDMS